MSTLKGSFTRKIEIDESGKSMAVCEGEIHIAPTVPLDKALKLAVGLNAPPDGFAVTKKCPPPEYVASEDGLSLKFRTVAEEILRPAAA